MPDLLVSLRPELVHRIGWIERQEGIAVAVAPDRGTRTSRAIEDLLGRMPSVTKPAERTGNYRVGGEMPEKGEVPQPVAAKLTAARQT